MNLLYFDIKIFLNDDTMESKHAESPRNLIREARISIRRADYLEAQSDENRMYLKFAAIQRALARDMLGDASDFIEPQKPELARILRKESYIQGYRSLDDYKMAGFAATCRELKAAAEKLKGDNPELFSEF